MIAKPNLKLYSKYMQQGVSTLKLILVIVLLLGLAVGIYLISRPQTYRSKASVVRNDWTEAIEMTDSNGNKVVCNTSTNPPECTTTSPTINIKVTNPNLLIQ